MHALATPMATTSSSITVRLLAATIGGQKPENLTLAVGGHDRSSPRWRSFGPDDKPVWYAVETIGDLPPATRQRITLSDGRVVLDESEATTLPVKAERFGVMVGSCFDVELEEEQVRWLYQELDDFDDDTPHINLWLGDQVYVDAPALGGIWPKNPRKVILGKYRKTWGLGRAGRHGSGLAYAMGRAGNWFIPDDHEFWNNYPHGSFTLFGHSALRLGKQMGRYVYDRVGSNTPRLPHPSSQGSWGRAAGAAYCVFQTDIDLVQFDESVNPLQRQVIDIGSMVLVLVDTRWHRTIRKGDDGFFMPQAELEKLVDLLTNTERLVCVGLSRPIVGNLPHRGPVRDKVDYAPEDFPAQYRQLWAALNHRGAKGWPTLVLGGDVHNNSVRLAQDDTLLEVVSSPMGHLVSLREGPVAKARRGWEGAKKVAKKLFDWRAGRSAPPPEAFPVIGSNGIEWEAEQGRTVSEVEKPDTSLTAVTFDLTDESKPVVGVRSACYDNKGVPRPQQSVFTWTGSGWQ